MIIVMVVVGDVFGGGDDSTGGGAFLITIHLFGQFVRFSQGNSNCQTNEW